MNRKEFIRNILLTLICIRMPKFIKWFFPKKNPSFGYRSYHIENFKQWEAPADTYLSNFGMMIPSVKEVNSCAGVPLNRTNMWNELNKLHSPEPKKYYVLDLKSGNEEEISIPKT